MSRISGEFLLRDWVSLTPLPVYLLEYFCPFWHLFPAVLAFFFLNSRMRLIPLLLALSTLLLSVPCHPYSSCPLALFGSLHAKSYLFIITVHIFILFLCLFLFTLPFVHFLDHVNFIMLLLVKSFHYSLYSYRVRQ